MNNGFVIRKYEENDYSAIINYCLHENQAIYTSLPENVIKEYKKDKFNQAFVVYNEDRLIGCFALYSNKSGNIYTTNKHAIIFKSFSIDSRFQKKGYALQTLKNLPEIIKLYFPNKDEVILTVHYTNIPAITLYKKAGFIDNGLRYEGEFGEELIFHLKLDNEN